jgi:hypothetical protein
MRLHSSGNADGITSVVHSPNVAVSHVSPTAATGGLRGKARRERTYSSHVRQRGSTEPSSGGGDGSWLR